MGRNQVKSAGKFPSHSGHVFKNSRSLMLTIPEVDLNQESLSPLLEKEIKINKSLKIHKFQNPYLKRQPIEDQRHFTNSKEHLEKSPQNQNEIGRLWKNESNNEISAIQGG